VVVAAVLAALFIDPDSVTVPVLVAEVAPFTVFSLVVAEFVPEVVEVPVVLPVLVVAVDEEAPSIVAPADDDVVVVLADVEAPAALDVPCEVLEAVAVELSSVLTDEPLVVHVVELVDPLVFASDVVVVDTVVSPVVASFSVDVVVVFTPLSVVTTVTGPFAPSDVEIVVVDTPELAVLEAVLLVDVALLLVFDVLVVTVVDVVVVVVVMTSPDEVVSFLIVVVEKLGEGVEVVADVVVPVELSVAEVSAAVDSEFIVAVLPASVAVDEVDCKPRSDTIATDCGLGSGSDYAVRREMQL
jgi:hypothetical protein